MVMLRISECQYRRGRSSFMVVMSHSLRGSALGYTSGPSDSKPFKKQPAVEGLKSDIRPETRIVASIPFLSQPLRGSGHSDASLYGRHQGKRLVFPTILRWPWLISGGRSYLACNGDP